MGVLAGTPRAGASRALVLGGAAVGCGALAVALAARVGSLAAQGAARPDDLVEMGVLVAGALVLAWLAGSSCLAAACLVARDAGRVWRRGEGWVHRFAPAVVRRTLVVVVAAGLGAASVGAASAADLPPTSPTSAASAVSDAGQIDLGWVVTGPGRMTPPTTTTAPGADATVGARPAGPAAVPTPAPVLDPTPVQSPAPVTATAPALPPAAATPVGTPPAPPAAAEASATWHSGTAAGEAPSPARGATPRHAAPVAGVRDEAATVVVLRGDTLWAIAARHLPPGASAAEVADAWPAWYAANAATIGPDPGLILPGQVLVAPTEVAR